MNTEYCENLGCYISRYQRKGYDIYKFHARDMVSFWRLYAPNFGDFILETENYDTVLEYIRTH